MKRIYTIALALLLTGTAVMAQQAQPQQASTTAKTFTLDQCIDYALKNHADAMNAVLDTQAAREQVKETAGMGLPQVVVGGGLIYNPKLPRFFQAYQPPTDGGISFFPNIPGLPAGSVVSAQNFFQLQASGDANVTINQLLFNGSYFVGLQAANAFKDYAYKNATATRVTVIQNVTKAYYAALINNDRLTSLDANIARTDSTLRSTKVMFENGLAENIDVQRLQVAYNNLVVSRSNFFNSKEITLEILKFNMGYSMDEEINVAGSIEDVEVLTDPAAYASDFTYENRSDYQALQAQQKMQGLSVKNNQAMTLPTLSAYYKTGFQTQSDNIGGLFKTNSSVPAPYNEAIGADKWFNYSVLGVSLNWNLFTGMTQYHKIQREKITLQKLNNSFRLLKSSIDMDVKNSALAYNSALKTLQSQKENTDLASNVYRVTRIKFEQGVGSNIEVVTAESEYRTAQNTYYQALFDAMVAKVDLDKAYGRLKAPESSDSTK